MKLARVELNQSGRNPGEAVVFLHGFGGWASQWHDLQSEIAPDCATLAFDLPGHGGSGEYPGLGPPKIAAGAVIGELETLKIKKAHLVGHSMGGAVAALIALIDPKRVASLSLLAPGGFGQEINSEVLLSYSRANDRNQFAKLLPELYANDYAIDGDLINEHVAARQAPGVADAMITIADLLFDGGQQGILPLQSILHEHLPTYIVWGSDDKIVPSHQADKAPNHVEVEIVPGAGHTLYHEAPQAILTAIRKRLPI